MDEVYRPILRKGDGRADIGFDIDYNGQRYEDVYEYITGRRISYDLDWYYVRPTFCVDVAYGINSFMQARVGGTYSIDYRYRYSYTESDTSVGGSKQDWREDVVNFENPFSVNGEVTIRPNQSLDLKIYGYANIYENSTHSKFSNTNNTTSYDMTAYGPFHYEKLDAVLTWLSDPCEKRNYIKSDIDGILHPLLGRNQLKIVSRYTFEDEESGYRDYKYTIGQFSQERWNRSFFYNEAGLGLLDWLEADVNNTYYLPYVYRTKVYDTLNSRFDDTIFKSFNNYNVGMSFKANRGQNTQFELSGNFDTRVSSFSANRFTYKDLKSSVNYPYPGKIRQDIYTLYCGQTYISAAKKERSLEGESFDRLEQPNLEKNQFLLGASFSYMVKLYENRYDQEDTPRRFAYKVDEYSIMCLFRYGVTDSLEVWANGKYAFPHKTKYVYFNNITDNPDANYSRRYPENLYLDFGGLLRLRRDIQLSVNAGFMPEGSVYYQIDAPNIRGVYYDQEYLNYTTSDGTLRSRNFLFYDYYARVKLSKLF